MGASAALNLTIYAVGRHVAGDLEASRNLDSAFLMSALGLGLSPAAVFFLWWRGRYRSDVFMRVMGVFGALSVAMVGTLVAFYWPWFFWEWH